MDLDIVKVIISTVIAVVGWIVGHYFNSRRDATANRKRIVTDYQINSYRKLNAFACALVTSAEGTQSLADDINSAVGDIQLFGTHKQIQLVKSISEQISKTKTVPCQQLTELLLNLRDSLRIELDLVSIEAPIAHLHIEFNDRQ